MASVRKRGRVWYYRFTDADGIKRDARGCTDKRATEEMGRAAELEAARRRAGLTDPKAEAYRDHEACPLSAHLDDFEAAETAKGSTPKHVKLFAGYARRVAALASGACLDAIDAPRRSTVKEKAGYHEAMASTLRKARLSSLTPSRVQAALSTLKGAGLSAATVNHHAAAIKSFASWAKDDGRIRDDPTASVNGYNANEDRRHDRRTISLEELRRLIVAAESGPDYRLMTGPARALCYRLAVSTGLRYSELKSLTPASFDLSTDAPTVTVTAAATKNGEAANLPLTADVASDVRRYIAPKPTAAPLFALPDKGADMLKVDLDTAGIAYRDASGRVYDFHALRCQCATLLDAAGVSPRIVQRLMRHSSLELSGRYTRPRVVDIEQAVGSIPALSPGRPDASHAATGTEGRRIKNLFGHYLATGGDATGRNLSDAGGMRMETPQNGPGHNPLQSQALDGDCRPESAAVVGGEKAASRTRTEDLLITNELLYQLS